MKRILGLLAVAALLVGLPALAAGKKVALLRADSSKVKVDGKPAKKLQPLTEGSTLTVPKGVSARVDFLKSGKRQTVKGPATFKVAATGLSGKGKIVDQKAATFAAMNDIGAQKKMGGGAVRASFFDVGSRERRSGAALSFNITGPEGESYPDPYCARIYSPPANDLWEAEELTGDTLTIPAEVSSKLEAGKLYVLMTYTEDDYYRESAGHALPFMPLSDEELAGLEATRKSLLALAREQKDPAPLLLLMEVLDEKVQINAAAEVACEAYTMADKLNEQEQRRLLETAHRLVVDANRKDLHDKLPSLAK